VTNHSSKSSVYLITVDFTVDGESFDTGLAFADDVDPGESVALQATASDPPAGDADCVVSDVQRFKAGRDPR
jgi:hypothetical protein